MNIKDIIEKKINKGRLTEEEIKYFIKNYCEGIIPDYQASALITAIKINGMNEEETFYLTEAMIESGKKIELSEVGKKIYDKHSTGGVGDKVTLVLLPILSALGFKIAKMSGRSLGYTGGTVDKLESVPGFKINLEVDEFVNHVKKTGMALMSQTPEVAYADKKIYELRDAIACTDSIPLIASSIMSKKIASGANNIILDVTFGSGAFMKKREEAKKLEKLMVTLGKNAKVNVYSQITSMEEPLGFCVGNSLEVLEAMAFLNGRDIPDLKKVVYDLVIEVLKKKNSKKTKKEYIMQIDKVIENKKAYMKFIEFLENQGANLNEFKEKVKKQNGEENRFAIVSKNDGIIKNVDAHLIAKATFNLGAGRKNKEEKIDYFSRNSTKQKKWV